MARQAHSVFFGVLPCVLEGFADGGFVLREQLPNPVAKRGVIHERKHPAADTEEPDAVAHIPFEDWEQISGVPRTQFTNPL
jgi:hypothetical protein